MYLQIQWLGLNSNATKQRLRGSDAYLLLYIGRDVSPRCEMTGMLHRRHAVLHTVMFPTAIS